MLDVLLAGESPEQERDDCEHQEDNADPQQEVEGLHETTSDKKNDGDDCDHYKENIHVSDRISGCDSGAKKQGGLASSTVWLVTGCELDEFFRKFGTDNSERIAMVSVVHAADLVTGSGRTARFEGETYGSGVSFYLVDNDPGQGPGLHRHPYTETWFVRSGSALITVDGESVDAKAGDILTVPANTPHKFVNSGTGPLQMVCIHASPTMIQENLE